MWTARPACVVALLSVVAASCSRDHSPGRADASRVSADPAGALSITTFSFRGWHDESFHYLPALAVTASATGRPVFVQRVDFTAEDAGTLRLLKGIRYAAAHRVQPGATVELVPRTGGADPAEISSPFALGSISAIVFFTDDEGQTGLVSAAAKVPEASDLPRQRGSGVR